MSWRNCNASLSFVAALNARYPNRDKASDGTIGDAAHASRSSDHNPWVKVGGQGVVRARDVDKDGVDAAWIVEELRKLGQAGDPRLAGGGYIIFNRRITRSDFSGWSAYNGSNPHDKHFHVSFSRNKAGFDSGAGWAFLGGGSPAPPAPTKAPEHSSSGLPSVRSRPASFQRFYNATPFVPALLPVIRPIANNFGPQSLAALKKLQAFGGTVNGYRCTPLVADGIDGPHTKRKLWDLGWRG